MLARKAILLFLALDLVPWVAARAVTINVNSTADIIADDGQCTLREAILASNTDTPSGALPGECPSGTGTDNIELQSAIYTLSIPGPGEDYALTGDLDVRDSVGITGAGRTGTVIDGNDLDRVFHVLPVSSLSMSITDLTVRDGTTSGDGGAILNKGAALHIERVSLKSNSAGGQGGALHNYNANYALVDSLVEQNSAASYGGGISSVFTGTGSIVRSVVTSNTSGAGGGGVGQYQGTTLTVEDSTIAFNTAGDGGGLFSDTVATLTVSRSTLVSNIASDDGGGIWNDDSMTISNSTMSGNTAVDSGGGLRTNGSLDLRNSTVIGNTANQGSAVYNLEAGFSANTVISGTCAGSDPLLSLGGNIESPGDTCGLSQPSDQLSVSPSDLNMGPLADNGGSTLTQAPVLPSVAVDGGVNGSCLDVDQRGVDRPQDGDADGSATCDVGSVELTAAIEVFSDGFESGDTSAWSSTTP